MAFIVVCTQTDASISAIFREAAKWGRVECFKLAVSRQQCLEDDPTDEIFVTRLTDLLDECAASNIELEYVVLDDSVSIDRHPRYLLGMHSGLHFDWGFDTGNPRTTNHIEWMGQSVLEPLLKRFT